MPKVASDPHFDCAALCEAVLQQDIGLAVSTNDPATFKRRLYAYMAKNPQHKLSILAGQTANSFLLVKPAATEAAA